MIYLDASALAKLVVEEPESVALAVWLDERGTEPLCTSLISRAELIRAARRRGPEVVPRAQSLLAECALVPLDAVSVDIAALLEPTTVRTVDALHVAAALSLGTDVGTFVSYDVRQRDAAVANGLPVAAPGV
ncbi:MAG: type II toxin-antitoxin system VapC family toxin [Kineosporiaceae bacterium]